MVTFDRFPPPFLVCVIMLIKRARPATRQLLGVCFCYGAHQSINQPGGALLAFPVGRPIIKWSWANQLFRNGWPVTLPKPPPPVPLPLPSLPFTVTRDVVKQTGPRVNYHLDTHTRWIFNNSRPFASSKSTKWNIFSFICKFFGGFFYRAFITSSWIFSANLNESNQLFFWEKWRTTIHLLICIRWFFYAN